MVTLRFDNAHPFFDEAMQFVTLTVSTCAMGLHAECDTLIGLLADSINKLQVELESGNTHARFSFDGPLEVPDYPKRIVWRENGFADECILDLNDQLIGSLVGNCAKPNQLDIVMQQITPAEQPTDSLFPSPAPGFEAIDRPVPTNLFETTICYLVGGAFERQKLVFSSKHGDVISWPVALQFFRHLRNGCFHSNRFDIRQYKGKDQIDPFNPPQWHSFVMLSDTAMNGKKAIGENGFISAPHVLPLLHEMGQYLN